MPSSASHELIRKLRLGLVGEVGGTWVKEVVKLRNKLLLKAAQITF